MTTETKLLTLREVAAHFRVNERTVRRWVDRGCPVLSPSERTLHFELSAVTDWCQQNSPERAAV